MRLLIYSKCSLKKNVLNTNYSQEKLSRAKQFLQEEYDTIVAEILNSNIKRIEQSNEQSRHEESWKLINKVTRRRNPKRGKIKVISKEDHIMANGTNNLRNC